jgi:glycosyltransferase involved in cell wall biosynthesis
MVRWLADRRVPALVDVKDRWPTDFLAAFPPGLDAPGRLILRPYYQMARRAMRDAAALTAMSESFLGWALEFCGRPRREADFVLPLTSPVPTLDEQALRAAERWWTDQGVLPKGPNFCFVGSHTSSFDFTPVARAAEELARTHPTARIVICGVGEKSSEWRGQAQALANVSFPGWIDVAQLHALAARSAGFLAPYRNVRGFDLSIPNKVIDAISMGLPIVTPLRGEVADLVERHDIGLRYDEGSPSSLHERMVSLIDDDGLRARLSRGAVTLYQARFRHDAVYGELVRRLEGLASGRPGHA